MKGKLIVLEGTDASGKSTQFKLLCKKLEEAGVDFKRVTFPRYDNPSAALVNMYLTGKFGNKPDDVNPYVASAFYAVDRCASYLEDWKEYYLSGGLVLCDRYTTSNAVHQTSKLPEEKRNDFLDWLFEFEYKLLDLPKPDLVMLISVPAEVSRQLLRKREGNDGSDIHEKDASYLQRCADAAINAAKHQEWDVINCMDGDRLKSIEEIHADIYGRVSALIAEKR